MTWSILLVAAIELAGVTGEGLRARAFFDANNVKVGDPMILTIDFIGAADFSSLHPPALALVVDRTDWKVDDASAKTDTFDNARRLTYRVRPLREGVLYFPALEYEYNGSDGSRRTVRANEIPVHAKHGAQVRMTAEMEREVAKQEAPALKLILEAPADLSDDLVFAWKKALAKPSATAFAAFDFPAAKLNEAMCLIDEGKWAEALQVYRALEWHTGQTPEIERGIRAALALRYDDAAVELPLWRQLLRPVLKYGWPGRVGIILVIGFVLVLLFFLVGRGIRALACVAIVLSAGFLPAETIETVTTNSDGSVTTTKIVNQGGFSYQSTTTTGGAGHRVKAGGFDPFSFFEREESADQVKIGVGLSAPKERVVVGETFELVLTIEHPRRASLASAPRLTIGEMDFFQLAGEPHALPPTMSPNATNIFERYVFPLRANMPFPGPLHYSVAGEYLSSRHSFFAHPKSYASGIKTMPFVVCALPEAGQPADFSGIIAESLSIFELPDVLRVETNDVVTLTYQLRGEKLYLPREFLPPGAAFEWAPGQYKGYWVADGSAQTPEISISYYNPRLKAYKRVKVGGTRLVYVKKED